MFGGEGADDSSSESGEDLDFSWLGDLDGFLRNDNFGSDVEEEEEEEEGPIPNESHGAADGNMDFAHLGHHSPSKRNTRTEAASSLRSPRASRSIPTKRLTIQRWLEQGAQQGYIAEEYQAISLLHADMRRKICDVHGSLQREQAGTASSAEPAASAAANPGGASGDAQPSNSVAEEPPRPPEKKVRSCHHRVGYVPTLGDARRAEPPRDLLYLVGW